MKKSTIKKTKKDSLGKKKTKKKISRKVSKNVSNNVSKNVSESNKVVVENPFIEFKGFLSFLILHELSLKPLAGEDLAKKIGRRKGTILTPGTIYPALKKLKNKRLVKFEKQGRRKVYSLTNKGVSDLDLSYSLFSRYFYGLKNKIRRVILKK